MKIMMQNPNQSQDPMEAMMDMMVESCKLNDKMYFDHGIEEDEFGVRVWFAHKLDPTVAFLDEHGNPHRETPGFDSGNPIEYPAWLSTGDSSYALSGLPSGNLDDAIGRGNMIYGLMWEVSDDASIFNGNLRPYFPKPGAWWEPQGNAVISQSTSLHFIVQ